VAGETTRIRNLNVVAEALRRTQEQYRLLAEQASDGLLVATSDGRLLEANPAASELLGYSRAELLALRLRYLLEGADLELLEALQQGRGTRHVRMRRKDGSVFPAEIDARPLSQGGLQLTVRDDSERARVKRALEDSEERFQKLLQSAPDAIALESQGRIVLANQRCAELLGFAHPRELSGLATANLARPETRDDLVRTLGAALRQNGTSDPFATRLQRVDGSLLEVHIVPTATTYQGHPALQIVMRETAPSVRPAASSRDDLTGLPTRELFDDRLSVALAQAFRHRHVLAVVRIDVQVDSVARSLGRPAADALLRSIAGRLTECVREGDTVARLGATEFGLLLPGVRFQDDVTRIAEKVMAGLGEPLDASGTPVQVGANAGVSLFPQDGDGPGALVENAGTALRRARETGTGRYENYSRGMERDPLAALSSSGNGAATAPVPLAGAAPQAGAPGVLHYQPVFGIESDRIEGFETFLRWQHPELGLVFPRHFLLNSDFISLILAIGPWIIRTACAQVRSWQRRGRSLRLAVNLSPYELRHPDLVKNVSTALEETSLAPRFLQLEVPEEWAMEDVGHAAEVIRALRGLGASVCLDGFGEDNRALLQLRRLPVDSVKLNLFGERSISSSGGDEATRVASAISMAKSFQLRVIAQGVESPELLEQLRTWQCDEVQGYHWGPPMSPTACDDLLLRLSGRLRPYKRPARETGSHLL
jgi:diguanylate cyclase (GGDEF)-like protein/PAS domain S-box-containing protein